jgi:TonB-dependent SusC/RagA subfamily outer membrane receptor
MVLTAFGKVLLPQRNERNPASTKMLLIMKFTAIFLFAACLQVSARSFSQKVSYNGKDVSLLKVFSAVTRQTGYVFFYDYNLIKATRPVTVTAKELSLKEFLENCFKNQPLGFSIEGRMITVSKKAIPTVEPQSAVVMMPPITIHGRITDSAGTPLSGAAIKVKGGSKGTVTDENGEFTIKGVNGADVLVVSFVGYGTREIAVNNRTVVAAILRITNKELAEVTVEKYQNGYQALPLERSTGAYDQIDRKLLERSVSTDIISRLNGVASGLLFDNTAGNGINMQIRGMSTIQASTQPLIILDNFPYSGDLTNINPNDIESITILKDAAASSIWGVRAGNGVVVLTSKKGHPNQPLRVEMNANITVSQTPNLDYNPNFLDSKDFINVEQQLFANGFYASQLSDNAVSAQKVGVVSELHQKSD